MTTQKDFKRLVRGRMQKTGESYTTARASLRLPGAKRNAQSASSNGTKVESNDPGHLAALDGAPPQAPKVRPRDFAKVAGMSDEKVKEKTGCTWERWVHALDHVEAFKWPHSEIARYVHEKYKVPGWWTQTVTVGYERIRGLREKGQRRAGSWEASKSKTIGAAVGTVFKAFKQPKLRSPWLATQVVIRTSVPNKSLRITWHDGTSVEVYLTARGRSRTQVAIQHTKLTSKEVAEGLKAFWAERLNDLADRLETKHT